MKRIYGKHRYTRSIANGVRLWLILVVLVSSIGPMLVSADVVWSDDFNDGNYDGWIICENPGMGWDASNWSAASYYLQVDQEDWGSISRPSNIAYGTWSFDFKANETQITLGRGFAINFISNDINNVTNVVEDDDMICYWLRCRAIVTSEDDKFELSLRKWYGGVDTALAQSATRLSVADWHHIDMTRNTTGWFSVYHNGSLVMQGVDTAMTTSELFVVSLTDWHMIDNVVVDDEIIPPPTTTPTTTTPPPFDWLLIGVGVSAVVIIVVLVIIIKRR